MMSKGDLLDNPRKILVRATNWIGDAVMSLPALEALRTRYPQAEIVVLAKPWVSELYWYHPAVSRQIVYHPDSEHRGVRGFWKLAQELREEEFDAAILFQNAFHAGWLAWWARVPVRIGYARDGRSALLAPRGAIVEPPPPSAYGHQVYYYLNLLFRAGIIDKPKPVGEIRLRLAEDEKQWAVKHLDSLGLGGPRFLVGIHPGASYGPAKRWLPEHFAALADRMIGGLHADVLIFGSAEEQPLAEEIARAMQHTPTLVSGQTTLRQMMALLAQCHLVVTNDSGPMHVAAALGLPLVAIFGSTDERATGPVGSRARTIKHPVACSPCGLRACPIDFRCMRDLSVAEVYQAAIELVRQYYQ